MLSSVQNGVFMSIKTHLYLFQKKIDIVKYNLFKYIQNAQYFRVNISPYHEYIQKR